VIDISGTQIDDAEVVRALIETKADDWPSRLNKFFWDGLRSRQAYEIASGDLMHTDEVIEMVVMMLKDVRTAVTLFVDNVERDIMLTEPQRVAIINLSDDLLADMREKILLNKNYAKATTQSKREMGEFDTVLVRTDEAVQPPPDDVMLKPEKKGWRDRKPTDDIPKRKPRSMKVND